MNKSEKSLKHNLIIDDQNIEHPVRDKVLQKKVSSFDNEASPKWDIYPF